MAEKPPGLFTRHHEAERQWREGRFEISETSYSSLEDRSVPLRPFLAHMLASLALAGTLTACVAYDRQGYGRNGSGGGRYSNDRISYRCDDNRRLTVTYDRSGNATVDTEKGSYDLRATGRGQYSGRGGDVQLEARRDSAYLRIKGQSDYKNCQAR